MFELTSAGPRGRVPRVPGEPGVWVLIFGDMLFFAALFGTFGYYDLQERAIFANAQHQLSQGLGLLNTLLLLTSSLLVALGVAAGRDGRHPAARRCFAGALMLGGGFVVVKAVEYGDKISAGIYPTTSDFFMLYFALTGVHLMHVLAGLALLIFARSQIGTPRSSSPISVLVESAAIFWHLVDMLWVMLFAILYLHR